MNITRRTLAIGSAALAIVATLPSMLVAEPLSFETPMIPMQNGHQVLLLGISPVDYSKIPEGDFARMLLQFGRFNHSSGTPIKSAFEAEDYLAEQAHTVTEKMSDFPFAMRRQAAYVAKRCYRGWPSRTFMHPKLARQLQDHDFNNRDGAGEKIGRWTKIGNLQKLGETFTSRHMPKNEILMVYRGVNPVDSCMTLLNDQQGNVSLIIPHENDFMYGISDYATRLTLI